MTAPEDDRATGQPASSRVEVPGSPDREPAPRRATKIIIRLSKSNPDKVVVIKISSVFRWLGAIAIFLGVSALLRAARGDDLADVSTWIFFVSGVVLGVYGFLVAERIRAVEKDRS